MDLSSQIKVLYENTDYIIDDGKWILRIGIFNSDFHSYLIANEIFEWSFITAFNPYPYVLDENENQFRNTLLENKIISEGYAFLPAEGKGASDWSETSFFIMNIPKDASMQLASAFDQLAFVYGTMDAIPELIFLRKN